MARVMFLVLSVLVMPMGSLRAPIRNSSSMLPRLDSSNASFPQYFEDHESTSNFKATSQTLVTGSTANEVSETSGGLDVAAILKTVFWILEKAARAVSIYLKASDVKLALRETKLALEEATAAVERMGTKLLHASDYFLMTGLPAFLQCIEEGSLDCLAKADFSHAICEIESLADELDDLLGISRSVIAVMKTVRSIADDVQEISDGLLDIDLDSLLVPLENQVEKAVLAFDRVVSVVKDKCGEARAAVELFVINGEEYAKKKAQELFGAFAPYVDTIEQVYSNVVKPLVLQMAEGVKAAYEAARRLKLPLDAPESVADETVDSAQCSWRQTRWFKSIEGYNVDIEKTMVCEADKTLGRWFKCWCVGTKDCYVPSQYRPAPVESRRCFKKE